MESGELFELSRQTVSHSTQRANAYCELILLNVSEPLGDYDIIFRKVGSGRAVSPKPPFVVW